MCLHMCAHVCVFSVQKQGHDLHFSVWASVWVYVIFEFFRQRQNCKIIKMHWWQTDAFKNCQDLKKLFITYGSSVSVCFFVDVSAFNVSVRQLACFECLLM